MAIVPTTPELEEEYPEAVLDLEQWLSEDLADPTGPARAAMGISEAIEASGCEMPMDQAVQVALLESATVRAEIERTFSRATTIGVLMIFASRWLSRRRSPLGDSVGGFGLPPNEHITEMNRHRGNANAIAKRMKPVCSSSREMMNANEEASMALAHWHSIPVRMRESTDLAPERAQMKDLMNRMSNLRARFLNACIRSGRNRLDGLGGAAKVCVQYFRGPSGKVRCKQWSSGAGYQPGPHPEGDYFIPDVREFYSKMLCEEGETQAKCGLRRKYRYRRSLPYLPREVVERMGPVSREKARIPPQGTPGAIRIIALGPAPKIKR